MTESEDVNVNTDKIREWRSIITLIVFVLTNILVLFPRHVPVYVPHCLRNWLCRMLYCLRITGSCESTAASVTDIKNKEDIQKTFIERHLREAKTFVERHFIKIKIPLDFTTVPLIADLFLLAIQAIGRKEVHDGTVGTQNIFPIDIMAFFLTLAYIAISIDASGLIRYLAFRVLKWGQENGYRLYSYLYGFFFLLSSLIGNDPVILSGTAFLAYMTHISANIERPTAWIHAQFTVANVGSAILVSSNPTNLVLAGAFRIKFIAYTANMIVPVLVTGIVLLPFLLFVVFSFPSLIPTRIEIHKPPANMRKPENPNIPYQRQLSDDEIAEVTDGQDLRLSASKMLAIDEVMNPFLDKRGASFGAAVMTVTLVTILALNAATDTTKEKPVYWVTLPAATVMLLRDIQFGWQDRARTRQIARERRQATEDAKTRQEITEKAGFVISQEQAPVSNASQSIEGQNTTEDICVETHSGQSAAVNNEKGMIQATDDPSEALQNPHDRSSLTSLIGKGWRWSQETFPTVTAVLTHLPFKLIPFALCMFVLVQGLVTQQWVAVFAHGWNNWINKTGTVGAVGGMGFLSVVMCNFAGTNIGTTILLCRVVQGWVEINRRSNGLITERTFWATIYSMAIGVNYGAFSTAFSASLAGLLWRDILARKKITVKPLEFAKENFRIIAVAMIVGLVVLIAEVYIVRGDKPYVAKR